MVLMFHRTQLKCASFRQGPLFERCYNNLVDLVLSSDWKRPERICNAMTKSNSLEKDWFDATFWIFLQIMQKSFFSHDIDRAAECGGGALCPVSPLKRGPKASKAVNLLIQDCLTEEMNPGRIMCNKVH